MTTACEGRLSASFERHPYRACIDRVGFILYIAGGSLRQPYDWESLQQTLESYLVLSGFDRCKTFFLLLLMLGTAGQWA